MKAVRFLVVEPRAHCRRCTAPVWAVVGKAGFLDDAIRTMQRGPYLRHIVVAPAYRLTLGDSIEVNSFPLVALRDIDLAHLPKRFPA